MATSGHHAPHFLSGINISQLGLRTHSRKLESYLLKGVKRTSECKCLGHGSFGVVDEVYFQGTLCAAKHLHSSLLDPRLQGTDKVISRFVEECQIMTSVRHPNIVQFLGLHKQPDSTYPTLVMEKLAMSLDDLLEAYKMKEDIPLSLKVSILSDTAKGLVYLHNHKPQIIHRDLTSRNVLLTLAMQAKITDLGNALIIDPHTVAQTMTQMPGAAVYMPPEAIHSQAKYDSMIDMFSYGHLALYTIIQEFPRYLLPATYMKESKLWPRNEIQRRERYISILHQKMGKRHLLTQIIERCLDNLPDERPSALQVLENLEEMTKMIKSSQDDFYRDYQHKSKLDLIKMFNSTQRNRSESVSSYVCMSIGPEGKPTKNMPLVDEESPPTTASSVMLDKSEQIQIGVPGKLALYKGGTLRKSGQKEYSFKISTSTDSLVYYTEKIKGEINLSSITDVRTSSQDDCNSFVISTKGREGHLKLIASSKDEHDSWVKALTQLISPNVSKPQQQVVTSTQQQDNQSVSLNRSDEIGTPKMHSNRAYGYFPLQQAFTSESKRFTMHDLSSFDPPRSAIQSEQQKARLSFQGDSGYDYIDAIPDCKFSDSPFSTLHGRGYQVHRSSSTTTIQNPKSASMEDSLEEGYIPVQSSVDYLELIPSKTDSSPESSMNISKTLKNLSPFSAAQLKLLIDMLNMTVAIQPPNVNSPIPAQAALPESTPPPQTPKPIKKIQKPPSQPSISTIDEKESGKSRKKGREGVSLPKLQLVVEPTKELSILAQRRKSTGMLNIAETPTTVKIKLARLVSESDATSKTSLLVTDDNPGAGEERPDWAKASTAVPAIIHSPLKDDPLTLLRHESLFVERSDLQNLKQIGEGQFGKVYKATLVQARSENITVAVKTIKKYESAQETSKFLHEMSVMMGLAHPNIIHLYGIVQQESPWLVLQYLPNGDLKNYLIKNKCGVNQLIKYMIDVAMGMHYIMERGLVHRDLAARNVMVDDHEICKVADFGLLREIPKDDTIYQATTEVPLPIRWMAPESLVNREFSPATDVWSFGVLLWEMYHPNHLPYDGFNNFEVLSKVLSGHHLPIPIEYPSTVAKIMKACWQKEPEKRPSFLLISQTLITGYKHAGDDIQL